MTAEASAETLGPEEFFEFVVDPSKRVDPYPFYRRLRAIGPIYEIEDGPRLATSYDCVAEVMRDGRFSTDERKSSMSTALGDEGSTSTSFGRIYHEMLLFRDDPDHKRLRDLVQKAFTRRVVEDLRGRIGALVDELVDAMIARGSSDLMSDFAYPLPVIVICELLGVPPEDRHRFHPLARDLATRFELQPLRTPEMEERGNQATSALIEYFDALIESKRRHPAKDLLTALVEVEDAGDRLTHQELLATCILILLAGHETTANLIGNGTLALLRNRDQWERLVSTPEIVRPAVEELLRYDTPVQIVLRIALEEIEIGGRTIPEGGPLGVMLGAANRDPSHFTDPDRLDLTRSESPIVAFGGGVHFCLGAPLARLEAQMAFSALARRTPKLDLEGEPQWRPSFVVRGLQQLPVRVA